MSDSLVLTTYDLRWPQEFQQARSCLLDACYGTLSAVEHIGSTAVPAMSARPIIDIVAAVASLADREEATARIVGLNFREIDDPTGDAIAVLAKPRHGPHEQHVYLTEPDSPLWQRLVRFRDWLNRHPEDRERYLHLKRSLIVRYGGHEETYLSAREAFFQHIDDQAETDRRE